ncbi:MULTISPECIES: universal stress protein [unclassified Streptomyces]|uniref:universal stress protein n=1 Tax=unclassified Streptomyces TaxID=2593676 RepID=UPI000DB9C863|nr:universal stress protein [Streptomyces sp. PsTaAH-137]MYT71717.1 universal stress protein [Streptomyces sp. SID8367]RAJ72550.1 universal stress protein family protein [Streptomyces sp. PsTaAH-137]
MYDDGFRAGRVVVGVSGSPASLAAVRSAVDQARGSGRPLLAVVAWEPPEGEKLYSRWPDRIAAVPVRKVPRAELRALLRPARGSGNCATSHK